MSSPNDDDDDDLPHKVFIFNHSFMQMRMAAPRGEEKSTNSLAYTRDTSGPAVEEPFSFKGRNGSIGRRRRSGGVRKTFAVFVSPPPSMTKSIARLTRIEVQGRVERDSLPAAAPASKPHPHLRSLAQSKPREGEAREGGEREG